MQYDFDTPIDRHGTGSYKWDIKPHELPMWVADMDFKAAPEITEAMKQRLEHGVFGYGTVPDEWYNAYINWWRKRHHFEMEKNWLVFCTGVVPAISSCVRKLTEPAENVLVQTPVYNIFFNSIRNNGRNILVSPLKLVETYTDSSDSDNEKEDAQDESGTKERSLHYEMDFEDLERKLADPQTTLMLLCNPQNPSGQIWDKAALTRVGELCAKYNVVVLSDEIHCDITEPGREYVPFASVSETCRDNSVTCIAASKAFNLAGLQSAAVMIPNKNLRHKVWRALNTDEVAEPNSFAIASTVAAFDRGGEWLDELREYISGNRRLVKEYLRKHIPELSLIDGASTYLLWIDARGLKDNIEALSNLNNRQSIANTTLDSNNYRNLAAFIREKTGLYLSDGEEYGAKGFLRMNVACPRSYVEDGLRRLEKGIGLIKM